MSLTDPDRFTRHVDATIPPAPAQEWSKPTKAGVVVVVSTVVVYLMLMVGFFAEAESRSADCANRYPIGSNALADCERRAASWLG